MNVLKENQRIYVSCLIFHNCPMRNYYRDIENIEERLNRMQHLNDAQRKIYFEKRYLQYIMIYYCNYLPRGIKMHFLKKLLFIYFQFKQVLAQQKFVFSNQNPSFPRMNSS